MKRLPVFALAIGLCACLAACFSKQKQTGYIYEDGTWNYASLGSFAFPTISKHPMDVAKNDLEILAANQAYARSKDKVYYKGKIVEGADPDTFEILLKDKEFARSKDCIFYKARIVEDADLDTFEIIYAADNRYYAKDKNTVYVCYDRDSSIVYRVIGADPGSFEVLQWPYAKDKNDAYCGVLPLFVDDVTTFEVVEHGGVETTTPDLFLNDIPRNARYNREKYGFVTEPVLYSTSGRARTATVDYYGYVAVEGYDPYHLKTYADLTSFGLGIYELRHEDQKALWDTTKGEAGKSETNNRSYRNVRDYEIWDTVHKGVDVVYHVIHYEGTYIIVPPVWEKSRSYDWGTVYLCKELDNDVDIFSIGIRDKELVEKLRELPGEQISRKDLVGQLGKCFE